MAYVSRKYLREKYQKLKYDMENTLNVLDEEAEDKINEEDVRRTYSNIKDSLLSILDELSYVNED